LGIDTYKYDTNIDRKLFSHKTCTNFELSEVPFTSRPVQIGGKTGKNDFHDDSNMIDSLFWKYLFIGNVRWLFSGRCILSYLANLSQMKHSRKPYLELL